MATSRPAGAQFDSSIRIRVVDANGTQLGNDRPICAYVYVDGQPQIGSLDIPSDPNATYSVRSGSPVHVGAAPCGDNPDSFVPMWSYGAPLIGGLDPNAPAIVLSPGETRTVDVRVGKAVISGSIAGPDAERVCAVHAISIGAQFTVAVEGSIVGTEYDIAVPPGRWVVRAKCEAGDSVFGPGDAESLDDAEVLNLADGAIAAAVNVSPARESGGSALLLLRLNEASMHMAWCADYVAADGAVVEREVRRNGNSFFVATRVPWGEYRVRIWDCGQAGFDDRWFPFSRTFGGAATVTVPEGQLETIPEGLVQLVVDPDRICNGLPATLVGTNGRDRLYGTDGADVILALAGRDVIRAGDGPDTVCGGEGRDVIFGGPKADTILGGTERDRLKGGSGADVIFGERGRDVLIGGFGNDTLYGNGGLVDLLDGREGSDRCVDPSEATIRIDCEDE